MRGQGNGIPNVAIVILNWKERQQTIECLVSIADLDYPNYQVIVIDNGFEEGNQQIFQQHSRKITYVKSEKNLGFAGGCNLGIRLACEDGAEFVWLLNNDARVERDTLSSLVDFVQDHPECGLLSPKILNSIDNRSGYIGTSFDFATNSRKTLFGEAEEIVPCAQMLLWGTALFISAKVIDAIGYFDERYFAYYEDYDLSIRALRAGYKNCVVGDAKVIHPSKSHPQTRVSDYFQFYMARNEFLFWEKNFTKDVFSEKKKRIISKYLVRSSEFMKTGHMHVAQACLDGVFAGLFKRYGNWDDRFKIPRAIVGVLASHPYFFRSLLFSGLFRSSKTLEKP